MAVKCRNVRGKWRRIADRGVGDFCEGRVECDVGINMRQGAGGGACRLWANCGGDCGLTLQGVGDRGFTHTLSCKDANAHLHTTTRIFSGPSKS